MYTLPLDTCGGTNIHDHWCTYVTRMESISLMKLYASKHLGLLSGTYSGTKLPKRRVVRVLVFTAYQLTHGAGTTNSSQGVLAVGGSAVVGVSGFFPCLQNPLPCHYMSGRNLLITHLSLPRHLSVLKNCACVVLQEVLILVPLIMFIRKWVGVRDQTEKGNHNAYRR